MTKLAKQKLYAELTDPDPTIRAAAMQYLSGHGHGRRLRRPTHADPSALADLIRTHRVEAGLTQIELAQRLGIGGPRVCQWELGLHSPRLEVVVKMCEVLGISPQEVFDCFPGVTDESL
jgi:DNA-binding XRE family transcriptional regulator